MRRIELTQCKYAIVDDEDFEWLSQYKWHLLKARKGVYASTWTKGKNVKMHRLIMSAPKGKQVDHRDGNGLNNRRGNLRLATNQQNSWNRNCKPRGTSKYVGVSWHKKDKRWQVKIRHGGANIWLGNFKKEVEAARCYDKAVKEYRGEFGTVNGI